jgi:hypothetical protein
MFEPGANNQALRFARAFKNQLLFYFDEYTRPDSVRFLLKISDTASIAVDLVELSDYGWAGILIVPEGIEDGFYEYALYFDGSEDAYGTGTAVINDAYAPQGPAIVQGVPGSQIYKGAGAPDEYTPGVDGDFYFEVDEYNTLVAIYGPKESGDWGDPINV